MGTNLQSPARRYFLKVGAAGIGSLVVGCRMRRGDGPEEVRLGVYVTLLRAGQARIDIPVPEIGQGVRTAMAAILADEIGLSMAQVEVRQAPAHEQYGGMAAAGSDSMADYYEALRLAGAEVRARLTHAAARRLNVSPGEVRILSGLASEPGGDTASVFELLEDAAEEPESLRADPKADAELSLIGRAIQQVEAAALLTGRAEFGLDVRLRGMCFALIERPPVLGAKVNGFDATGCLAVPGVTGVERLSPVEIPGERYASTRGGVAVLAESVWAAMEGRSRLRVDWGDLGTNGAESSEAIRTRLRAALDDPPGAVLRKEGQGRQAFAAAERVVRADYELPLLGHNCMEPMNFTADVREDRIELRGPIQVPRSLQQLAAALFRRPLDEVHVIATRAGGGFGRRLAYDYAIEALQLARRAKRPVQVIWTREDDASADYLRPPSAHRLEAAIDARGRVVGWFHHLATSSLNTHIGGGDARPAAQYDTQGAAELPFRVDHLEFAYSHRPIGLQCGSWRSVSHSANSFVVNAFIDEVAEVTGTDVVDLHRGLFGTQGQVQVSLPLRGRRGRETTDLARYANVCRRVCNAVDWGRDDRALGFAACRYKDTYCACVAEAMRVGGLPRIVRITTAIDCGKVINPRGVEAQVEGAALDGWASVFLWGETVAEGRVRDLNFDRRAMPRMSDMPHVQTVIVASSHPPSGAGEPPYPAVAPAIVNALFRLTGQRYRRLPIGAKV